MATSLSLIRNNALAGRTAASLPGNLLETRTLRPHPGPTASDAGPRGGTSAVSLRREPGQLPGYLPLLSPTFCAAGRWSGSAGSEETPGADWVLQELGGTRRHRSRGAVTVSVGGGEGPLRSTVTAPSPSPLLATTEGRPSVGFLIHQLGLLPGGQPCLAPGRPAARAPGPVRAARAGALSWRRSAHAWKEACAAAVAHAP